MSQSPHLLLVNLGTPTAPTEGAVREFLAEFLSDPAVVDLPGWIWQPVLRGIILRRRPARVARQYASIWSPAGSPLRVATERMVAGLRATAAGRFQVSAAYRYGQPSIDQEIARVGREGSGPLVVVPLFPQRTDPTTGTAFRRAAQAAGRNGISSRLVPRLIEPDDRGYVEAMVARWNQALAQATEKPEHLVVSFHGIPVRYDRREGRTYTRDCEATTRALVSALGWPAERTTLAYQSKFGPEPWLLPATAEVLERLPRQGIRRLAVITPGFLTEGLETIEEIGIRGAEAFAAAGGSTLIRIGAVEDHPAMLRSLAALAIASS